MKEWIAEKPKDRNGYVNVVEIRENYNRDVCTCYNPSASDDSRKIACVPEMYEFIKSFASGKKLTKEDALKIINKYKGIK